MDGAPVPTRSKLDPLKANGAQHMSPSRDTFSPSGRSYHPLRNIQARIGQQDSANLPGGVYEQRSTAAQFTNGNARDVTAVSDGRPSEAALLHDLPFTLQGLSTKHLPFTESALLLPPAIPAPLLSLLRTLAEPSLLYRELSKFVESSGEGLVRQSLRAAIGNELHLYRSLIATLEKEIRRSTGKVGATLKRCVIWTREPTLGLRLLSLMVEGAKSKAFFDLGLAMLMLDS